MRCILINEVIERNKAPVTAQRLKISSAYITDDISEVAGAEHQVECLILIGV